jgi:ribonuclease Z
LLTKVVYIIRGPKVPGKFNPAFAKSLGVKKGPDFGRLVSGESVITENGIIVTPDQCVLPPKPPSVFFNLTSAIYHLRYPIKAIP